MRRGPCGEDFELFTPAETHAVCQGGICSSALWTRQTFFNYNNIAERNFLVVLKSRKSPHQNLPQPQPKATPFTFHLRSTAGGLVCIELPHRLLIVRKLGNLNLGSGERALH